MIGSGFGSRNTHQPVVRSNGERTSEQEANNNTATCLADMFLLAIGMGLKRPMIRVHYRDMRYKIYLSRNGSVCFKAGMLIPGTSDPQGDEYYIGCLRNGRLYLPSYKYDDPAAGRRQLTSEEQEFFDKLRANPVGFLAECSKDLNRCCYCNQPLEDERSKDVGYGPVCAERWGLPWGKSYDEKAPSFAQVWGDSEDVRALCAAIREDAQDETSWAILGDALEDAGCCSKKPSAPNAGVVIPQV